MKSYRKQVLVTGGAGFLESRQTHSFCCVEDLIDGLLALMNSPPFERLFGDIAPTVERWRDDLKPGDDRVTRVGRFLRRTSLDELPQLFKVLKGDLALVGPKPHPIVLNEKFVDVVEGYAARHRVKPGVTGWAQVNGWGGETDTTAKMATRVERDRYYVENWSHCLDLKILFLTLLVVVRGENAH